MHSSKVPEDIAAIADISADFHQSGTLSGAVIIEMYSRTRDFENITSIETGCGKSTLLFSAISRKHFCFTRGNTDGHGDDSLDAVLASPRLNKDAVSFVLGPTQKTLPDFGFADKFDVVFIDGPHGFPFPQLEYYYLYPHLKPGGLLIIDDIHIPTIGQLADFLKEDAMFDFTGHVGTTAFFRRTSAPVFDPMGDGWWLQQYNTRRFSELSGKYFPLTIKSIAYRMLARTLGVPFADKVRKAYRRMAD